MTRFEKFLVTDEPRQGEIPRGQFAMLIQWKDDDATKISIIDNVMYFTIDEANKVFSYDWIADRTMSINNWKAMMIDDVTNNRFRLTGKRML